MEAEQPSTKPSRLKYLLAIFAVTAPVGYLIGISFYQGYLSSFGVSAEAFPLTTQDIYIQGYWAVGLYIIDTINWLSNLILFVFSIAGLVLGLALFFVVTVCVYLIIKKDEWVDKVCRFTYVRSFMETLRKLSWRENHVSKALGISGLVAYAGLFLMSALGAISLCWIFPSYLAVEKGKDYGNQEIERYLRDGCVAHNGSRFTGCKSLISDDGDEVITGLLIAQAGDYIAFFDQDGSHIMRIPSGGVILSRLVTDEQTYLNTKKDHAAQAKAK